MRYRERGGGGLGGALARGALGGDRAAQGGAWSAQARSAVPRPNRARPRHDSGPHGKAAPFPRGLKRGLKERSPKAAQQGQCTTQAPAIVEPGKRLPPPTGAAMARLRPRGKGAPTGPIGALSWGGKAAPAEPGRSCETSAPCLASSRYGLGLGLLWPAHAMASPRYGQLTTQAPAIVGRSCSTRAPCLASSRCCTMSAPASPHLVRLRGRARARARVRVRARARVRVRVRARASQG